MRSSVLFFKHNLFLVKNAQRENSKVSQKGMKIHKNGLVFLQQKSVIYILNCFVYQIISFFFFYMLLPKTAHLVQTVVLSEATSYSFSLKLNNNLLICKKLFNFLI